MQIIASGRTARAEHRHRSGLGTELRLGHCTVAGDAWAILDCPGSVEFAYDVDCALAVADCAVVVCDPSPGRAAILACGG